MTASKSFVYRFADVEVREREFRVTKAGDALAVEPKAFRVLLILLRNPQRLISKDELLSAVWGDAAVTENSLTRAIVKLRKALEDDSREPRFIETVATVGYRFLCPVESFEDAREPGEGEAAEEAAEREEAVQSVALAQNRAAHDASVWKWVAGCAMLLLALGAGWLSRKHVQEKWARESAEPEIARLLEGGKYPEAAALAVKARAALPGDLTIQNLWMRATGEVTIKTDSAGAQVDYRPYDGDPNAWTPLGRTPVEKVRLPQENYVFRVTKEGYAPVQFIGAPPGTLLAGEASVFDIALKLWPAGSVPPEMTPVAGDGASLTYPFVGTPYLQVEDFLIDRHEVTNEDFKRFVDAGGYTRREFWKEPFVRDGKTLTWDQAMAVFHDATGRPGPSTWEAGSFPSGHGQHPASGVSWYEAMAYAAFAGKSLPTAYHWLLASQEAGNTPLIAKGSNFRPDGTQPVGAPGTLSGFGTTDMAGNVKEWCLNETWDHSRAIMGGGYGEPDYMFYQSDARPAWERRENFGFRCAKMKASKEALGRIEGTVRDYWHEKPVSNEVFQAIAGLFRYDKTPLNARVEERSENEHTLRERVSFDAAYGGERVTAYLFLPKSGVKPWQTVVLFPGAMATLEDQLNFPEVEEAYDFILKSGRALLMPVYKGTYQRRDGFVPGGNKPGFFRDHVIAWSKDLGRTVDYLETRKDMDAGRLAYMGFSLGGAETPLLLAVDKRFKAAVVLSGGYQNRKYLPESDPFNFSAHMTTPVLMLSGRYDDDFPMESSQRPFFQLLGTPAKDKKYVIYEGGHGEFPRPAAVRETLDWLDKYLGTVGR